MPRLNSNNKINRKLEHTFEVTDHVTRLYERFLKLKRGDKKELMKMEYILYDFKGIVPHLFITLKKLFDQLKRCKHWYQKTNDKYVKNSYLNIYKSINNVFKSFLVQDSKYKDVYNFKWDVNITRPRGSQDKRKPDTRPIPNTRNTGYVGPQYTGNTRNVSPGNNGNNGVTFRYVPDTRKDADNDANGNNVSSVLNERDSFGNASYEESIKRSASEVGGPPGKRVRMNPEAKISSDGFNWDTVPAWTTDDMDALEGRIGVVSSKANKRDSRERMSITNDDAAATQKYVGEESFTGRSDIDNAITWLNSNLRDYEEVDDKVIDLVHEDSDDDKKPVAKPTKNPAPTKVGTKSKVVNPYAIKNTALGKNFPSQKKFILEQERSKRRTEIASGKHNVNDVLTGQMPKPEPGKTLRLRDYKHKNPEFDINKYMKNDPTEKDFHKGRKVKRVYDFRNLQYSYKDAGRIWTEIESMYHNHDTENWPWSRYGGVRPRQFRDREPTDAEWSAWVNGKKDLLWWSAQASPDQINYARNWHDQYMAWKTATADNPRKRPPSPPAYTRDQKRHKRSFERIKRKHADRVRDPYNDDDDWDEYANEAMDTFWEERRKEAEAEAEKKRGKRSRRN